MILRHWIWDPNAGNAFLDFIEAEPYGKSEVEGLISPSERREFDAFSNFLVDSILPRVFDVLAHFSFKVLHQVILLDGAKKYEKTPFKVTESGNIVIKEEHFVCIARTTTVMFATLFPSIAVVALYFIPSVVSRLGAIMAFSFVFAAALAIFTNASLPEIFGVTAAYVGLEISLFIVLNRVLALHRSKLFSLEVRVL
jgi:hypothetical protein